MRYRRGIALAAALFAIVALSSLAALAAVAARIALHATAAAIADAQAEHARVSVRARLDTLLANAPRGDLRQPANLGTADTFALVTDLAWPWHRVEVRAGDVLLLAELAYARLPELPWCSPVVIGGDDEALPVTILGDPELSCGELVERPPMESIEGFIASLADAVAPALVAETLAVLASDPIPRVWLATGTVEIGAGRDISGLVVAPVVRVAGGARVRGAIVAAEVVFAGSGALVQGDRLAVAQALNAASRLRLLGRRGLLSHP